MAVLSPLDSLLKVLLPSTYYRTRILSKWFHRSLLIWRGYIYNVKSPTHRHNELNGGESSRRHCYFEFLYFVIIKRIYNILEIESLVTIKHIYNILEIESLNIRMTRLGPDSYFFYLTNICLIGFKIGKEEPKFRAKTILAYMERN